MVPRIKCKLGKCVTFFQGFVGAGNWPYASGVEMLSDPQEGVSGLQDDVAQKALKRFQRATLHDLSPSRSLP